MPAVLLLRFAWPLDDPRERPQPMEHPLGNLRKHSCLLGGSSRSGWGLGWEPQDPQSPQAPRLRAWIGSKLVYLLRRCHQERPVGGSGGFLGEWSAWGG